MCAMNLIEIWLVGLFGGLHAASWGAFKDSPFEGFKPGSFVRSVVLGMTAALFVAGIADVDGPGSLVVLIGLAYALERLLTEWWKSIVREDEQDAYSIPMRLAVHGQPVDDRSRRYACGVAIATAIALACWGTRAVQSALPVLPAWGVLLVAGSGGWLTAVGGAWKDAPIEGFSRWKFLRSPLVATGWALVLIRFTGDWLYLAVACGGWSVISIETYKTFLAGGRPPGKFAGKPVLFQPDRIRMACRALHVGVYGALAAGLVLAFASIPLTTPSGVGSDHQAVLAVALVAAVAAVLVLAQRKTVRQSAEPKPVR
jgi:hypothetical protein